MNYEVYSYNPNLGRDDNETVLATCDDAENAQLILRALSLRYLHVGARRVRDKGHVELPRWSLEKKW